MVLPGNAEIPSATLAVPSDDLRQLADHDAAARVLPGGPARWPPWTPAATDRAARSCWSPGSPAARRTSRRCSPPLAGSGYRVVAIDQRGQYESPGPDDPAPTPWPSSRPTSCAVAHLLREETGTPHLVGHSFGGLVGRAAVLADPAAFRSLTLLGSGPARLTGPRVALLEHLGPLLDSGGVRWCRPRSSSWR
jgi:pimeloyl-ACP methyl ester carboxylesterase